MGKRKRPEAASNGISTTPAIAMEERLKSKKAKTSKTAKANGEPFTIQIVTGSYDRVLHGITANVSATTVGQKETGNKRNNKRNKQDNDVEHQVQFADTFLFNAHSSAIRCLALSPPSAPEPGRPQKIMLATGSSDERINVYSLSAHPPVVTPQSQSQSQSKEDKEEALSTVVPRRRIAENRRNRELGSLLHHSSTVTRLVFPVRGKLISASEDSTIAITRTRDFSLLSSIRVPRPQPQGRPSGDTAALGATPAGVNDVAVHPSMRVMLSVGRGERSMRLWNLTTGKRAAVLNFPRDALHEIGEGRHSSGEGRRVVWHPHGEDFCVGFDRDLLVFNAGTVLCRVMPDLKTKIHDFCYVALNVEGVGDGDEEGDKTVLLAVSTEDGRIVFFSTAQVKGNDEEAASTTGSHSNGKPKKPSLPHALPVAQLGGKEAGLTGRIKDFAVLDRSGDALYFVCGSSDGKVRLFRVGFMNLKPDSSMTRGESIIQQEEAGAEQKQPRKDLPGIRQVGRLVGEYETQNRITCLEAFVMIPRPDGVEDSDVEDVDEDEDEDEDDDEDEDEDEDDE